MFKQVINVISLWRRVGLHFLGFWFGFFFFVKSCSSVLKNSCFLLTLQVRGEDQVGAGAARTIWLLSQKKAPVASQGCRDQLWN